MNYFGLVSEIFMSGVEVWLLYFLCSKVMNINEYNKWYILWPAGICVTLVITIATNINAFSVWKTLLCFVLLFIFAFAFFNKNLKETILTVVIYYASIALGDMIAFGAMSIVKNHLSWNSLLLPSMDRLTTFFIAKIIIVLLIYIFIYFRSNEKNQIPSKYWFLFLFLFSILLCLTLIFVFIGFSEYNSLISNVMILFIVVAMLLIYLAVYYLFYQTNKNLAKVSELSMLEYQNETIEKYLLQSQEYSKVIRVLSHDLKHNLFAWKELSTEKGYSRLLQDMVDYESLVEDNCLVDTGHDVANAIINQKILVAKKNNITFDVRGTFKKGMCISKIDLCSLLGNMIDNAIEATQKIEISTKRKINLVIKNERNILLIEVENNYALEPILRENRFVTRKKSRTNHGIGMISIDHVVSKYDGAIQYSYKDKVFKMDVMLNAYDKNLTLESSDEK